MDAQGGSRDANHEYEVGHGMNVNDIDDEQSMRAKWRQSLFEQVRSHRHAAELAVLIPYHDLAVLACRTQGNEQGIVVLRRRDGFLPVLEQREVDY